MSGAWERENKSVLLAILTREIVTTKWAIGFRNLALPSSSGVSFRSGAPYDVMRNSACSDALEAGFQWCLRPDTLIETDGGSKPIVDVRVGDRVRTHLGRFKSVTDVFVRTLRQGDPYLWIKTPHSTIKVTDGHPFFVARDGSFIFVRASQLRKSDCLLYPVCSRSERTDRLPLNIQMNTNGSPGKGLVGSKKLGRRIDEISVTSDVARFFGLYLAEGCGGHDSVRFTFGNHETKLHDFIVDMCRRLFDRTPTIHRRWATTIKLNIRSLSSLFTEWFGAEATNKVVPEFVFKWSLRNRLAFIHGYIEGDGSIRTLNWRFRTASHQLATGMQRLAESCGMSVGYAHVNTHSSEIKGRRVRSKESWAGWFGTKSVAKARDLLLGRELAGYIHIPITAIESHRMAANLTDSNVYNLEVEADHSFIADSAAVHNCLFLDDDVIPPPDVFGRLARHNADIVSGLYHRRQEPICPVAMKIDAQGQPQWVTSWSPPDCVLEVDLVGAGCLLIHRRVLERMPRPWFEWEIGRGDIDPAKKRGAMSEDFAFCMNAKRAGFKVHLDTSIRCDHVGLGQASQDGSFRPSSLP
jgi:hypothetical protein